MLKNLYGIIINGKLKTDSVLFEGCKPVIYADIPKFDQETQYIIQSKVLDRRDDIYFGIDINTIAPDDNLKIMDIQDCSGFRL